MRNALLALHTVRYLRPVQIYGRLWFRLYRPLPDARPAPQRRPPRLRWHAGPRVSSMTGPCRFRFLAMERSVCEAAQWSRGDVPKLWLYNLHYFDDLVADAAHTRRRWHGELIQRWIAENPPGHGIGWDPYPLSLRIVNWVRWALAGNPPGGAALDSLATQARWLRGRLEIHLLGNHLWANAKALIFAGLFFAGQEAEVWLRKGLSILQRQLAEQILPDGGHFERSPMYHAIILGDLLDLIQLAQVFSGSLDSAQVRGWRSAAAGMLRWLRVMSHPNGEIAFFNDAALDGSPSCEDLCGYASRIGVQAHGAEPPQFSPIEALPDSGYVRLQRGPAVMIADVGEIGPDYQPGHAHADTLSFELSLHGQRVFVNGGTSTYEPGAERLRQRGTAAHNTVVVDEQNSSEIWAGFRVARRARPRAVSWRTGRDALRLQGTHDGYRRLARGLTHTRCWHLWDSQLAIEDVIAGPFTKAHAMFLVNPDIDLRLDQDSAELRWSGHRVRVRTGSAVMSAEPGTWHPRFGVSLSTQRLRVQADARRFRTRISW